MCTSSWIQIGKDARYETACFRDDQMCTKVCATSGFRHHSIFTLFAGLELKLVAGVVWEKNIIGWLLAGNWCWSGVREKYCWAGDCWSCRTEWLSWPTDLKSAYIRLGLASQPTRNQRQVLEVGTKAMFSFGAKFFCVGILLIWSTK